MDYKDTVFLPKSSFGMRGGLPQREPEMIDRWNRIDLWGKLRDQSKNKEKFILHDGPPYANGPIHIGTSMNKILKDIINRSKQMTVEMMDQILVWLGVGGMLVIFFMAILKV